VSASATISRPLILVTSFEPFGGSPMNPTIEISKLLASMNPQIGSRNYLALPVIGGIEPQSAWHAALQRIEQIQPDVVVALGESAKADCVHIEMRAVNVRDSRIADNAGLQLRNEVVIAGAPDTHSSTLPTRAMLHACLSCGVPAQLSTDAGTFLCNEIMFRLLEHVHSMKKSSLEFHNFTAGFIHVPQLPEQALVRGGPSMDSNTATRAVHAMLEAVAANLIPKVG
jgi:pyroglutamyl-peptidase